MKSSVPIDEPVTATDWAYLNEGNMNMAFLNKQALGEDLKQPHQRNMLMKCMKQWAVESGNADTVKINEIMDKHFNNMFLMNKLLSPYLTTQRPVVADLEKQPDFYKYLYEIAEEKRIAKRKGQTIGPMCPLSMEKNLFYVSPEMTEANKDCVFFYAEIKPKCYFTEKPSLDEIKDIMNKKDPEHKIDVEDFYNKHFIDCSYGKGKFVKRKHIGSNKNVFSKILCLGWQYDPEEWYSMDEEKRVKANKCLMNDNWGYTRIYDKNAHMIQYDQFEEFFKGMHPELTKDLVGEAIAKLVDTKLLQRVKTLQSFYHDYPDAIAKVTKIMEEAGVDNRPDEACVEEVMAALCKIWESGDKSKLQDLHTTFKCEKSMDYAYVIGFLISRTMRDCSYLLRISMSKDKTDLMVVESDEPDLVTLDAKVGDFNARSRVHLVDVALKFWEKLVSTLKMYRKVNEAYVENYLGVGSWIEKLTGETVVEKNE